MARKRRMEQLRASRSSDDDASQDSNNKRARLLLEENDDSSSCCSEDEDGVRRKPSLRGIKKQARYEPGVPMTKEELAAWRKEARRVRNRESAAASRQKTKERIEVLEAQVSTLQAKYDAALHRIAELEGQGGGGGAAPTMTPFVVAIPPQRVSPQPSPKITPASSPIAVPPQESNTTSFLEDLSEANLHQAASQMLLPPPPPPPSASCGGGGHYHSHDNRDIYSAMILRPTAVCV